MSSTGQYVTDENGNKVAIILPLTEYEHMKEDLHDLAMVAERRDEGTIRPFRIKKACDVSRGLMSPYTLSFKNSVEKDCRKIPKDLLPNILSTLKIFRPLPFRSMRSN